jgi:hypothetical protein
MNREQFEMRDISHAIGLKMQKHINILPKELEIINGLLLGDGHIELNYSSKNDYSASLVYTCKHKEVLELLAKDLKRFNPKIYFKKYKTGNCFNYGYRLITHQFKELLDLRNKWYQETLNGGIKFIPKDINLTPLTCYWWYLGDGSITKTIILCTHSFTNQDVDFLISKLPLHAVRSYAKKYNKDPMLVGKYPIISVSPHKKFLEYIGPCLHRNYIYKWTKPKDRMVLKQK